MEPPSAVAEVDETADPLQRLVAILIMAVTLIAAGVAFLQTQAGNRESVANRQAEAYSVQTLSSLVTAGRNYGQREIAIDLTNDFSEQSIHLGATARGGGPAAAYAAALSHAYHEVSTSIGAEAREVLGYDLAPAGFERFYVEQYRPSYAAIEYQKAYARERDEWGGKSGQYITVITVLAVALFLLGLSLTVPSVARPPFLIIGTVVALAPTVWAGTIWLRAVEKPSDVAVEAYARGQAQLDALEFDPNADKGDHDEIVAEMTAAIEARPEFLEAYLARGVAYFNYDLAIRPGGPQGSSEAQDDWQKVVELDPESFVGWLDLGAAQFWLDAYPAALESTRRALTIKDDEPISNLNYALFFIASGDEVGYQRQMGRVREVIAPVPAWLRNAVMLKYRMVIERGIQYRPAIADPIRTLREDLLDMVHEIDVSNQMNGTPNPPPVEGRFATPEFTLSADGLTLEAEVSYTGMKDGQSWLYRIFVDGLPDENSSIESQPFDASRFSVPDGRLTLKVPSKNRFTPGQWIRVEIFVEGNLLTAGEYIFP